MRKIPTIYQRDPATKLRYVMNERHPDCGWVFDGEGQATYKWDGTAVLIDDDGLWKRREVKGGKDAPDGFKQEGPDDPETGKRVGWVPVDLGAPENQWHREAWFRQADQPAQGTYELVGPKVQSNPHQLDSHRLIRHGSGPAPMPGEAWGLVEVAHCAGYESLAPLLFLVGTFDPGFEGVVWHHPDGRMAKIKAKDFPR